MQTFKQTFASAQTWELNIVGSYFSTLQCTNPVNVRLYQGGQLLGLGNIQGLLAGLEVFDVQFDRVQIDVTGADTVQIGIGNGQARYNRINTNTTITNNRQPTTSTFANTAKTVTTASAKLIEANANRQYLLIQNKDDAGNLYLCFGDGPATVANGIKVPPGGAFEQPNTQSIQSIFAIGDTANNVNILVVEG